MGQVKQQMIDGRTNRPVGDHGTANQAIEYALDICIAFDECESFLRAWREGSLEEWPEYYEWLRDQEQEAPE